ncbi:hypothetical protein [Mycolicibacterium aubagnense]|nr:hypothetical protein [Mycolicibacterium aubagnense]
MPPAAQPCRYRGQLGWEPSFLSKHCFQEQPMNSDSLPLTANVNDQAEELTRAFCEFQSQPADHWRRASFRKTFRIMLEHDRYEFGDIMTVIAHLRSLESYIDDSRYQFAFDLRREYRRLHEQVVDLLNARGAARPATGATTERV